MFLLDVKNVMSHVLLLDYIVLLKFIGNTTFWQIWLTYVFHVVSQPTF